MEEPIRYWSDIPRRFYSDLEQKPFENCLLCEKALLQEGTFYIIEKAYRSFASEPGEKTLFEYAICLECAEEYRNQLSVESRKNIDEFMSQINFASRSHKLMGKEGDAWLSECIIHQEGLGEDGEAQIYGLCNGDQFCFGEFPYMIRSEAMEEIVSLLSAETLDELNRFKDKLNSGPPELQDILDKVGPRLLV